MLLTDQRDAAAARRFFVQALRHGPAPVEVTTDKAPAYLRVLDDPVPAALHVTEQYANNHVEADHARLKARLRPMRGLRTPPVGSGDRRRARLHPEPSPRPYELATDVPPLHRLTAAFAELALAI